MTLANIHSCKDFCWRGCERSWSDCSYSVIYYSWHGAVSNLCLFDYFFYLLCKTVKSFPFQLLLRNTGSHAKRKKVELTGGRSAARRKRTGVVNNTDDGRWSRAAEQQSRAELSSLLLCRDTWKRPPWGIMFALQTGNLLISPHFLIFSMLCIFTSSKCCSSKCRCNHSDSKAWKFWLGWTEWS